MPRRSSRRKVELPPLSIDLGPPPERLQHDDIGETATEQAGVRRRYVIDQVARLRARGEITDEQAGAACRWRQDRETLDRYSAPRTHAIIMRMRSPRPQTMPDRVANAIARYRRAEHNLGITLMAVVGPLVLDGCRMDDMIAARGGGRGARDAVKADLRLGLDRIVAAYRAHDNSAQNA